MMASSSSQPEEHGAAAAAPKRAVSHLSKKRWTAACACILDRHGDNDTTQGTITELQEILKFNPDLPTYTPEQSKRMNEWVKNKAAAAGVSTYIVSGKKRAYDRKKAAAHQGGGDGGP